MKIAKTIVAAVGTVVTVLAAALADEVFSFDETQTVVTTIVTAVLTIFGVWAVPNKVGVPQQQDVAEEQEA